MKKILNYYKCQLNELLYHTMTPTQTIHKITTDIYSLNDNKISTGDYNLYFNGRLMILELKNHYNLNEIYAILTSIYSTGYYISQYYLSKNNIKNYLIKSEENFIKEIKNKDILKIKFVCEPKEDLTVEDLPEKIYHITLKEYSNDILKNGLLPSSGKKKGFHPHRNFFIKSLKDIDNMKNSIHYQNVITKHKLDNKELKYEILEIDTKNLKSKGFNGNEYNIVFYNDENSNGIYTHDSIPNNHIKIYSL